MLDHQTDSQHTPLVAYTPVPYQPLDAGLIEKALTVGDVAKMDSPTRVQFYRALCASCGLNPLTRPFILLKTQGGELQWYPTVGCAEQLRKMHRVSTRIIARERTEDGLFIITVQASTPDGRQEESQGIVHLGTLKGQELANAMMKCGSKALRRVTFALCGLGMSMADEDSGGQAIAFDAQTGTIELPPEPAEAATLLTAVGQWFRQRPQHARETIAHAVWDCTLHEIPHLSQEALEAGWRVLDEGQVRLSWEHPRLQEEITQWRAQHAQQAINDVFGKEGNVE